jgi:hypothetical protein
MSYNTPKVTIDLDEYNELIEKNKVSIPDEALKDAKTVIAMIVNSRFNMQMTRDELARRGISFQVRNTMGSALTHEDILITKQLNKS